MRRLTELTRDLVAFNHLRYQVYLVTLATLPRRVYLAAISMDSVLTIGGAILWGLLLGGTGGMAIGYLVGCVVQGLWLHRLSKQINEARDQVAALPPESRQGEV